MEKEIWEDELKVLFERVKKSDAEILMNILSIVVFNRFSDKLGRLFKIINDMDKFSEIIDTFSDQAFRFPDSTEFREALILALVYYYRNVRHYSWEETQQQLKYEKDLPIRFGKRVASIDKTIQKQLDSLLNNKESESDIFSL